MLEFSSLLQVNIGFLPVHSTPNAQKSFYWPVLEHKFEPDERDFDPMSVVAPRGALASCCVPGGTRARSLLEQNEMMLMYCKILGNRILTRDEKNILLGSLTLVHQGRIQKVKKRGVGTPILERGGQKTAFQRSFQCFFSQVFC